MSGLMVLCVSDKGFYVPEAFYVPEVSTFVCLNKGFFVSQKGILCVSDKGFFVSQIRDFMCLK